MLEVQKPGVQQCAPASETSGSRCCEGGVALRRRRLPVDRLEYSHAGVPVAQEVWLSDKVYSEDIVKCDLLPRLGQFFQPC